ncbi:MAG: HAMP domain-containing protein [Acidobacteriaceae bacterium]|nr:HAMP domain-containing protein [Acidobacteriaceae bacterium]
MRRRLAFAAAALSFVVLLALVIWQGSFKIQYSPSDLSETVVLWAVSTLIFILTVTLAFMLFRAGVKVYIDRQRNKEGSRIRSKLLVGALALVLAPTLFYVVFSVYVLNRHLDAWFSRPVEKNLADLREIRTSYERQAQHLVEAQAQLIGLLPQTRDAVRTGHIDSQFFRTFCNAHGIRQLVLTPDAGTPMLLFQAFEKTPAHLVHAAADVWDGAKKLGRISVASVKADQAAAGDLAAKEENLKHYGEVAAARRKIYQDTYFRLICLITLFVLFFASWSAQLLSRQISLPISALLGAAQQVRAGNLSYRVRVNAMDELATLVRAFNEMTGDLESNARELEARRRFTEAILESIPSGVISVSGDERIERVNRALNAFFPAHLVSSAQRLGDLFSPEHLAELRYLLKRARRTGTAASQLELQTKSSVLHVAVTVAALEQQRGFVLVLEDTSDLLRAQKASAWQEVARRVAHEIKNPLTPISLCADRIARQISRLSVTPDTRSILEECTHTIQQEVQTVKSLVDEFSRLSRFPAAQPAPADLNEIVESAMAVFAGRLQGISVKVELERNLPLVLADKEQMKRVIVNLVDNAAEAMHDQPFRMLLVSTRQASSDIVELSVIDTGPGVSPSDKEKLFLPYFSTKARGTGLGLAIVSRIVSEHHGRVRVEDNQPTGTRFIVELNVASPADVPASTEPEPTVATLKA